MAARSTNRFKQKPAVPFGDFMLPILGIVALGIVVMGIRILWGPSEADKPTVVAQPRPAQSQDVSQSASEKSSSVPKSSASGKETVDDVIIAQPVRRGGRTQSGSAGTESAKNTGSAAGQKNDAGQQCQQQAAHPGGFALFHRCTCPLSLMNILEVDLFPQTGEKGDQLRRQAHQQDDRPADGIFPATGYPGGKFRQVVAV